MRYLFSFLTLLMITCSCSKNRHAGETVEIYLLKNVQLVPNKCQVDPSGTTIETSPLVTNENIIEYSKNEYEFKLTGEGMQKIQTLQDRTPFAVTVDREVIYYAIFKPGYSSSSCDNSITMDISWSASNTNKIRMRLGYPSGMPGVVIEDKRNDAKLIATLRKQGKLR